MCAKWSTHRLARTKKQRAYNLRMRAYELPGDSETEYREIWNISLWQQIYDHGLYTEPYLTPNVFHQFYHRNACWLWEKCFVDTSSIALVVVRAIMGRVVVQVSKWANPQTPGLEGTQSWMGKKWNKMNKKSTNFIKKSKCPTPNPNTDSSIYFSNLFGVPIHSVW